MAGKSAYLGCMIQSLEDNLDKMANRLEEVVQELINVKNVTVQGVSEINVAASDNVMQVLNNADVSANGTTAAVYHTVASMKALMNGSCKIKFDVTLTHLGASNSNMTFYPFISVNGTITEQPSIEVSKGKTVNKELSISTAISKGDNVIVGIKFSSMDARFSASGNSVKICYDTKDIVNQGGMALV